MTQTKENRTAGFRTAENERLMELGDTIENTSGIDNHLKAAEHFSLASKFHYEAAGYHGEGKHENANQSAFLAMGHAIIATEYQLLDIKQHTSGA